MSENHEGNTREVEDHFRERFPEDLEELEPAEREYWRGVIEGFNAGQRIKGEADRDE